MKRLFTLRGFIANCRQPCSIGNLHKSINVAEFASRRISQSTSPRSLFLKDISAARSLINDVSLSRGYSERIIKTPAMADSITEGELARWEKKVGDLVKERDVVAVIETDKVDIEVPSPVAGIMSAHLAKPGDTVKVGQELFKINLNGAPAEDPKSSSSPNPTPITPISKPDLQTSTAAAQKPTPASSTSTMKSTSVSPLSSPHLQSQVASSDSEKPAPSITQGGAASIANAGEGAGERRVKMSRMRLRIAERLKEAQTTAASLTTFNEIDMTNLMQFRSQYKDEFAKKHNGLKLGFMSAFAKASAVALQEIPEVNARIEGIDMVYNDYVDISVAVATPKGLVTPVLRNVENMTYRDIEKTISEFGEKARGNQITVDDMAGGTFTISNGGVFGSLLGTPILNPPQSAILGMHAIKERPMAINGQVVIRPMMYVALTYDHRMVDGREAVTFLIRVKELVEDPRRLLLDL